MKGEHPRQECEYAIERTPVGDRCDRDSEGYLHMGGGTSHIDSITITYQETDNR